jgi:NADH-quinone oxidoreductase subunit C
VARGAAISIMAPALSPQAIIDILAARYGDKITAVEQPLGGPRNNVAGEPPYAVFRGPPFAVVDREHLLPVLDFLKHDAALSFEFLMDVTAVDHLLLELPEIRERFAVVYQLYSLTHNHRFRLKARVPEADPRLPSACELWKSALWAEREVHDMFGIEFEGNPDLRRLLMPEDYPGFPLRKDYPLRGRGERDAFPQYGPTGGEA